MPSRYVFSFGYSKHHSECWFTRYWHIGMNDTIHDQWWAPTLGMDGIDEWPNIT